MNVRITLYTAAIEEKTTDKLFFIVVKQFATVHLINCIKFLEVFYMKRMNDNIEREMAM